MFSEFQAGMYRGTKLCASLSSPVEIPLVGSCEQKASGGLVPATCMLDAGAQWSGAATNVPFAVCSLSYWTWSEKVATSHLPVNAEVQLVSRLIAKVLSCVCGNCSSLVSLSTGRGQDSAKAMALEAQVSLCWGLDINMWPGAWTAPSPHEGLNPVLEQGTI